jgi:hypothetical protein
MNEPLLPIVWAVRDLWRLDGGSMAPIRRQRFVNPLKQRKTWKLAAKKTQLAGCSAESASKVWNRLEDIVFTMLS